MQEDYKVGERIKQIRENLNMNREKFSEMIDISSVFLGQIERGERSLSIKTLSKIVKFTGTSTDYILFGNDNTNTTILVDNKSHCCSCYPLLCAYFLPTLSVCRILNLCVIECT